MPEKSRRQGGDDNKDDWLRNYCANKIETALNDESGDVSELRQFNFNRYYGKQYGNERDGHSKFTTREVFEAVEWAMPSILRVFTSNERAVEFVARNEGDEQQAKEETDIANHYIQVENNGFLLMHNWAKDLLMNPNGYVKGVVEERTVVKHDTITGLTLIDLNKIDAHPDAEILEYEARQQYVEGFGMQELYDVRVRFEAEERRVKLYNVPPDEALIDDDWTSASLRECPFTCHRVRKSVSELVQEGYDADELLALGDTEDNTWNDERVTRLFYEEENPDADDEGDQEGASRMLWVHDMSVLADYDDDNVAERRHVVMIGDTIFDNDEDDYQPMVSCASIIIPHKHICMSYIEAVSDLQLLATTVTRQLLDNTYAQTEKRHYFREESLLEDNSTMDDYLDARSTAIIVRGNPYEAVMPEQQTPITAELLSVIQHIKEQPKMRTGVAPELSLDPSVLQQSTMGAFMGALDQASQRLDMLVRVIAEVGYKELMMNVHTLLRKHINEPDSVQIRGKWINFDTTTWHERTKMQVNVGLGHNNKQQKIQLLMGVLGLQKEAAGQGLSDATKIYNTFERLIEAGNIGSASSYFIDPKEPVTNPETGQEEAWKPPPPAPNPQMILAEAQAGALKSEQERKGQEAQATAQHDMQKLQGELKQMFEQLQQGQRKLDIERDRLTMTAEQFKAKYEIDSATGLATVRETHANVELKEAQTEKTRADAGLATSQARKTDIDASDEVREAQDILSTPNAEDTEGTTGGSSGENPSAE